MENKKTEIQESGALTLSDERFEEARRRAKVIGPLAERHSISLDEALIAADELGLSKSTIYELVNKWRRSGGNITSLIGTKPSGGKGKSRLLDAVEDIIKEAIQKHYLSRQKPSLSSLLREIRRSCRNAGLPVPTLNTVKSRIRDLPTSKVVSARKGPNAARSLMPSGENSVNPERPLDVVQIDHTKVDIIIVEEKTREPIGRPYLTVAIDLYSRCVAGYCLTLEAPSATSVGLCLAHCATDKQHWLEKLGVDVTWPVSGKPSSIHVDNAAEFHSEALRRGCEVHGIELKHRPPGLPHHGGTVERVIGTFMKMVHELPGTTFSNIKEREGYNSDNTAALTLNELEKWMAQAIGGVYHNTVHTGLKEPPIARWRHGIEECDDILPMLENEKNFLVDFLPVIRRKLQRTGFMIDGITYFSNSLSKHIAVRDQLEKFLIRRDPRDISRVWVLIPDSNQYLEVPYRTLSNPSITVWEQRKARERIRQQGREKVDEQAIFQAVREMRKISEKAQKTKKTARRANARRSHLTENKQPEKVKLPEIQDCEEDDEPKPFTDVEEW